jgi:hypothetical protein
MSYDIGICVNLAAQYCIGTHKGLVYAYNIGLLHEYSPIFMQWPFYYIVINILCLKHSLYKHCVSYYI